MRIAVIGGSGFIGTRLVAGLRVAHEVKILDRNDSEAFPRLAVRVDVGDADSLARELVGVDAVVHLATEARDDAGVPGTENVLAAIRRHAIESLVFASSVAVYGANGVATDEDAQPAPLGRYGKSKLAAETALRAWQSEARERRLTIVRPTVVFGEGGRGNVYGLMRQIAAGTFLMVGAGTNRKSMAYVENVADFLRFAVESNPAGCRVFNYADKPDLDMNELVALVREELGKPARTLRIPYALGMLGGHGADLLARLSGRALPIGASRIRTFCTTTVFSAERAARSGFSPGISLEAALRKTIAHEFGRNRAASHRPPPRGRSAD